VPVLLERAGDADIRRAAVLPVYPVRKTHFQSAPRAAASLPLRLLPLVPPLLPPLVPPPPPALPCGVDCETCAARSSAFSLDPAPCTEEGLGLWAGSSEGEMEPGVLESAYGATTSADAYAALFRNRRG